MRKRQKKVSRTGDAIPLPTTGKIFANGEAIEPLRDGTNADRLSLLFWSGSKATIRSEIICHSHAYEPAPIDPTILRALTLPIGITSCESPRNMLADISKTTTQFTGLPENSIAAMSRWMMSTWFPEMQPTPGLSLVGPDTTAGRQLFQLLYCLCRHPLLLTDVNAAGLRALPMQWQFTLLIHQPELNAEVLRILSIARRNMGSIPRRGRLMDFRCAAATYTEFVGAYGHGVIPMLEISLVPAGPGLPVLDDTTRQKIATDFQARLLGYRLAHYTKVLNSTFDAPELTASMQELAQYLSACTPDDPDLQAQVPELLRAQNQEIRSAAWLDIDTIIIETVLASIHEGKDCIYVGEIAKAAEAILWGRDENRKLADREIGTRLRLLGLVTEPRNSKGIRLLLTAKLSRRIHELAYQLSVPSIENGAERCLHCSAVPRKESVQQRTPCGKNEESKRSEFEAYLKGV